MACPLAVFLILVCALPQLPHWPTLPTFRSIGPVVRDGRLFDRATLDELLNQAAARLGSSWSSPSR